MSDGNKSPEIDDFALTPAGEPLAAGEGSPLGFWLVIGLVAGVILMATVANWVGERNQERARESFLRAWPMLPTNYGSARLDDREFHGEEREEVERTIDQLVNSGYLPVVTYALRSAFRWDHGDGEGAAQDMQVALNHAQTKYVASLALRLRQYQEEAAEDRKVPRVGLPAPVTSNDYYVAAFLSARNRDWARLDTHVSNKVLQGHFHADELRLRLEAPRIRLLEIEERGPFALDILSRAQALMAERPYGSATVSHAAANTYLYVDDYERCLEHCEPVLAASPASQATWRVAARAHYHLGHYDRALTYSRRALKGAPGDTHALHTLLNTLTTLGRSGEIRPIFDTHAEHLTEENLEATQELVERLEAIASGDFDGLLEDMLETLVLDPSSVPVIARAAAMGIDASSHPDVLAACQTRAEIHAMLARELAALAAAPPE